MAEAWRTACPDWQDRIREGRSLVPDLPLIPDQAAKAVGLFNMLRLPDVPGQPLMADAAGDWIRDVVRALFGSFDPALGVRHVREAFLLVPKKNSKTTAGAAIMVVALLRNRRPRAEFLLIAPTQDVADLAFNQALGMIQSNAKIRKLFHVQEHLKKVTYKPGEGKPGHEAFLKVKSFDPKIVTGTKPSGILLDELHVMSTAPDADRVIGQLRGGLISQPEAFFVTITTQSERPPAGVFKAELDKARAVRDGRLVAPILPVLYEFPEGVSWEDPANWHMVTPNAGRSITVERLIPDFEQARAAGPGELRRWASQHLNVEVGLNLLSDRWAGADHWEGRGDPWLRDLDELLRRCEVVTLGIDGGGLDDLLGLAVLGREKETRRWLHWGQAWCHRKVLDLRKTEAPKLRDFEAAGELVIVDDLAEAFRDLAEIALQVEESGLLAEIGVDMYGTTDPVDALADIGIGRLDAEGKPRIIGIPQGYKLNGAIKTAEVRLANGTLIHAKQSLMAWCVGNARTVQAGNAISITKQASGTGKIDPLAALFDAVVLMVNDPKPRGGGISVYEKSDLILL
jgi:phage terminase large subunit-like protein